MLLPAVLTGAFVTAAILAAQDTDWTATAVLTILAVITGVWALIIKKRVDNA